MFVIGRGVAKYIISLRVKKQQFNESTLNIVIGPTLINFQC